MVQVKELAAVSLIVLTCFLTCEAWSGNYYTVRRVGYTRRLYCICWYWWWGCSAYRWKWEGYYYYTSQCKPGWTHNGNYNCIIPVCRPSCGTAGRCTAPNKCTCDSTATGPYCKTATCSHLLPCYPGDCVNTNQCQCEAGFKNGIRSDGKRDGCLDFDSTTPNRTMYPKLGKCIATILNTGRIQNVTDYMFIMDGTNIGEGEVEEVWSNQKRFNILQFELESVFPEIDLPDRPPYVFDSGFGIVKAQVEVNLTKYSRTGSIVRDNGYYHIYNCTGFSDDNPETDLANCTIYDNQFKTLIEHGDWMEVAYQATSGGFRDLHDINNQNQYLKTETYNGLKDIKRVKFLFDFNAPKYCNDPRFYPSTCPVNPVMLRVQEEFTKNAIRPQWNGWVDDLSGMLEYYIEIFRLHVNSDGRLVEERPINPDQNFLVAHNTTINYPEYTPTETGIYSVLLEARDMANNSLTARRFVVYDPGSEITISQENSKKLYMSSASEKTDYVWQTTGRNDADGPITFTARWDNHFVNPTHEQGGFLNVIEKYPIQFEDIDASGVLSSKKYVSEEYDDYEGKITRRGITNFHGIVKFEVIQQASILDDQVPVAGWVTVSPLAETYTFSTNILDGGSFRFWVRATDEMGNSETDSTVVHVDTTGPAVTADNSTDLTINYDGSDAEYDYTSRIKFLASDGDSGVHEIHYTITVESFGKADKVMFTGNQSANFQPESAHCPSAQRDGFCYKPEQILDLNNCWFIVDKDDLKTSRATVLVTVYNRAMMAEFFTVNVPRVDMLRGLEEYTGPENFRVEETKSEKFRIAWDLPEKISCYGLTDIVLVIVEEGTNRTETVYVHSTKRYYDMPANPNTKYTVTTAMQLAAGNSVSLGTSLAVQTLEADSNSGLSGGVVAGVAVAVIALVAIGMIVFVVLIRRGHFQPVSRGIERARTVVRKKVDTVYGGISGHRPRASNKYAYDNRQSELYIYGGEFDENPSWALSRGDITFETLLKSGRFANIYKASLKTHKQQRTTVVAKTLKEGFTADDEKLMKAKIKFEGDAVGSHPNVLKFFGAVIEDHAMGPFIIYEYCEHGPLKDYLQSQKSNVTLEVQENLFKFGLDIAKGMEYLASKKIVHRRLAARNILLTFLNEVKIAGFGPQPEGGSEEDGDAEAGRKERIPIKWMSPECMESTVGATEKSDVWSYAVVLWEIFSLGATPYENIRSRELPSRIKKGERLPQPEHCDDTWYGVMRKCWAHEPKRRPTFSDIRNQLDGLFVASPGDDYYYYKR